MKTILLTLIIVVMFFGCNPSKKQENSKNNQVEEPISSTEIADNNFRKYIESLDEISLPFKHSSSIEKFPELSINYDKQMFEKFKNKMGYAEKPFGILFKNDNSIVTIDLLVGDIENIPVIMSYDLIGNKIDSLWLYQKSGYDMGYAGIAYFTIYEDRRIMVADSTKIWELNEDETNIIEDSFSITVDTVFYQITDNGKIVLTNIRNK